VTGTAPPLGSDCPLTGIRVLDFTAHIAGPYATQVLVELGADVVKVERPPAGDDGRRLTPSVAGYSTSFEAINRGKRSLAIDLGTEAGRDVALEMVAKADVIVENMRPGKMEALGLGFTAVSAVNPLMVYLSISGFGHTGPLRERPGYDMLIQARTGIMSLTGETEGSPVRVGPSIVDIGTGIYGALAVVTALFNRQRTKRGQWLDISLFDVGASWVTLPIAQAALSGIMPRRMGGQTPLAAPADIYRTRDGYMVLTILNDAGWKVFCALPEMLSFARDRRFDTNAQRVENRSALTKLLNDLLGERPTAAWVALLQPAGITCEPVVNAEELLHDPQALARGRLRTVNHPQFGDSVVGTALPLGVPEWLGGGDRPAPRFGEHSEHVLSDYGFDDRRIRDLKSAGVLA
jgi:crotonobetainyl-CoA:carnitine CoA-transferase CaiB-like acyl-CoA transferase